ncbi:MAG: ABC transporter permease [Bryobacteraceae bacterium]|nr:ABC transporter permease [Bryobacteraceae bacterium]
MRRIYQLLLRLFPAEFRDEYGSEMTAVFLEQDRRAAGVARLGLWGHTLADLSLGALQEASATAASDLRHAFRRLRAQPGLTAVAILSLAVGIGANTAIFSVLQSTVFADLPFADPKSLVMIWTRPLRGDGAGLNYSADFLDWRARARSFAQLALFTSPERFTLTSDGIYPERVGHQSVSSAFFPMLGVRPRLGRFFTEEDALAGETTALISERYWHQRFGGRPDIIGRKIVLDGAVETIIGVVPPAFDAGWLSKDVDVWGPINLAPSSDWIERKIRWLGAAGRLRQGVTLPQANAELKLIAAQLAETYPRSNRGWTTFAEPMRDAVNSQWRFIVVPMTAAVVFVLLIACANVTNLLLARAATRRRELALRAALGAARGRLRRELLADGFAIAIPGALLSLPVAWAGIRLFLFFADFFPVGMPEAGRTGLSWPVLAFSAAIAVIAAVLTALAPAWMGSRINLTESLKDGEHGTVSRSPLRKALVVGEFALTMVLLTSAGLMIHATLRARALTLGFQPDPVVTVELDLYGPRYARQAPKRDIGMREVQPTVPRFIDRLLASLREEPNVQSAALGSALPMVPTPIPGKPFRIAGIAPSPDHHAGLACVTSGYFETLGIPVPSGRAIGGQDRAGTPWVAMVNQAFVQCFLGGQNPIGQTLTLQGDPQELPRRIVGVVADHRSTRRFGASPTIYMAYGHQPALIPGDYQSFRLRPQLLIKTRASAAAIQKTVQDAVSRIDSALPVPSVKPLVSRIEEDTASQRFHLWLLTLLAGLALLLAAVGIGGLMHNVVVERLPEIGVRMALGADQRNIIGLILRGGMILAVSGLLLGTASTLAAQRLFARFLFGVTPVDPAALTGAAFVLLLVAALACYWPARRAAGTDPLNVLRRS